MQFSKSGQLAEPVASGVSLRELQSRAGVPGGNSTPNVKHSGAFTTEQRVRPDPEIRSAGSLSPKGAAFRPAGALRRTE